MSSPDICQPLDQALVDSESIPSPTLRASRTREREGRFKISEARSSAVGTSIRIPRLLTPCYSIRYPDPAIKVNDTVKIK